MISYVTSKKRFLREPEKTYFEYSVNKPLLLVVILYIHLVIAPVRDTKKLLLKGYVAIPLQLDQVTIN